jgi:hypothetical protein
MLDRSYMSVCAVFVSVAVSVSAQFIVAHQGNTSLSPQHTILNMVIVDYSGRIIYANVGRPGAMTDRSHYTDSDMWNNPLNFFSVYSQDGVLIREFVLGDNIYRGPG